MDNENVVHIQWNFIQLEKKVKFAIITTTTTTTKELKNIKWILASVKYVYPRWVNAGKLVKIKTNKETGEVGEEALRQKVGQECKTK